MDFRSQENSTRRFGGACPFNNLAMVAKKRHRRCADAWRLPASMQFQPVRAILGGQAGIRIDPAGNTDFILGLFQ